MEKKKLLNTNNFGKINEIYLETYEILPYCGHQGNKLNLLCKVCEKNDFIVNELSSLQNVDILIKIAKKCTRNH